MPSVNIEYINALTESRAPVSWVRAARRLKKRHVIFAVPCPFGRNSQSALNKRKYGLPDYLQP